MLTQMLEMLEQGVLSTKKKENAIEALNLKIQLKRLEMFIKNLQRFEMTQRFSNLPLYVPPALVQ